AVEASVTGGTITAGTSVTVKADDTSSITSEVVGVAVAAGAGGFSMGVSVLDNEMDNTLSAFISRATVTASHRDITVGGTAPQTPTTTALAIATSIAVVGMAGVGADATANLQSATQAYVSSSTLTAAGHKVYVHGASTLSAPVTSDGTAASTAIGVA